MTPLASYLLETLLTLGAVAGLAVVALFAARRFGVGRTEGPLLLLGRLSLEGRRAVYLVRVADTIYVIGASESGLTKLGEVEAAKVPIPAEVAATRFSEVLRDKLTPRTSEGRRDDC